MFPSCIDLFVADMTAWIAADRIPLGKQKNVSYKGPVVVLILTTDLRIRTPFPELPRQRLSFLLVSTRYPLIDPGEYQS